MNRLACCLLLISVFAAEAAKAQSFDPLCTGTAIGALIGSIFKPTSRCERVDQ